MRELDEVLIHKGKSIQCYSNRKVNVLVTEKVHSMKFSIGYVLEEINNTILRKPNCDLFNSSSGYSFTSEHELSESRFLANIVDNLVTGVTKSVNNITANKLPDSIVDITGFIKKVIVKLGRLNPFTRMLNDKDVIVTPQATMDAKFFINRYLLGSRIIKIINIINKSIKTLNTKHKTEIPLASEDSLLKAVSIVLSMPQFKQDAKVLEVHGDLQEASFKDFANKLVAIASILSLSSVIVISNGINMDTLDKNTISEFFNDGAVLNILVSNIVSTCLIWANSLLSTKRNQQPEEVKTVPLPSNQKVRRTVPSRDNFESN